MGYQLTRDCRIIATVSFVDGKLRIDVGTQEEFTPSEAMALARLIDIAVRQ